MPVLVHFIERIGAVLASVGVANYMMPINCAVDGAADELETVGDGEAAPEAAPEAS